MIDATATTMDANHNNFQSADPRDVAPDFFRQVRFLDSPNVEIPNRSDRPQQVLLDLHRLVGISRSTVDNCSPTSHFPQNSNLCSVPPLQGSNLSSVPPLQGSNLSSVPPVAGAFNATADNLLSSLSVLQQKARQLEAFVQEGCHDQPGLVSSILYELILTATSVLSSVKGRGTVNPTSIESAVDLEGFGTINVEAEAGKEGLGLGFKKPDGAAKGIGAEVANSNNSCKDTDKKVEAVDNIVEMNESDIFAEHTHFCEICGKGFKRDANVRMHMRAHGNEYKTHQALMSKPSAPCPDPAMRYSCPFERCRRNRNSRKFKPLKSMASLRNHYKRSHWPKMYTCNKCNKQFSVAGDLKSHGKNCGHNRWQCSCGTTFTRKDKLFGHVSLFEGHRPMLPSAEASAKSEEEENSTRGNENRPNYFVGNAAGLVHNSQSYGNLCSDEMLLCAGSNQQNDDDGDRKSVV